MKLTAVSQIKNTALYEAVKKLGSQHALAEHLGVGDVEVGRWVRLLSIPDLKLVRKLHPARWDRIEKKLVELTGKFLEEIFPQELLGSDFLDRPKVVEKVIDVPVISLLDAPREYLQLPANQELELDAQDRKTKIDEALGILTEREEKVLRLKFGLDGDEKTITEIGNEYLSVSTERVRQIEARALRKLRHPSRSNKLKPFSGSRRHDFPDSSPLPKLVSKTHQGDAQLNPSHGCGAGGRVGPSGLLTNTKCRNRPIFGEHCWHPITRKHMDICCYCNRPRGRYSSDRIEQAIAFRHRFSGRQVLGERKDFLKRKPKRTNHRNINARFRWKYKNQAERKESRRRRIENLMKGEK